MKDSNKCPFCGGEGTIEHIMFECHFAKGVWRAIKRQWKAKLADAEEYTGVPPDNAMPGFNFFEMVCLGRKSMTFQEMWHIVQSITAYHIWRTRCAVLFNKKKPPTPESEGPFIWQHVLLTLRADLEAHKDMVNWWIKRCERLRLGAQAVIMEKIVSPLRANIFNTSNFCKAMTHPTQIGTGGNGGGVSMAALPRRNMYSNPYWYQSLVDPNSLESQ